MNKFYSLLLTAAVTLSASALDRQQADFSRHTMNIESASLTTRQLPPMKTRPVVKSEDTESLGIEAIDAWKCDVHLSDFNGPTSIGIVVRITDPETGTVAIDIPDMEFSMVGQYDETAATLSIEKQVIGTDEDGDVYFYIKDIDEKGALLPGLGANQTAIGTVEGTTITFPEKEVWAFGSPDSENLGYYIISDKNVFYKDTWEVIAQGQFLENIVYPLFTNKQNTEWANVAVMSDGFGHYAVVDPLKALFKAIGFNEVSPTMELDVTDPTNVLVPMTATYIGPDDNQEYYYFSEGWYNEEMGGDGTPEIVKIKMTVEGDDVTITFPTQSFTMWLYPTQDKFNTVAPYVSYLKFKDPKASVEDIILSPESTDSDAPVRYYNLQGSAVSNPASGSVVIRVQGSKATKEIIR